MCPTRQERYARFVRCDEARRRASGASTDQPAATRREPAKRCFSPREKHLNYGLAMSPTADDRESLRARIFPSWPPRDGLLMRTARVGSWESQFVGAGRLTAFVSDHLLRFGAALDDIGLGLVFLQHHRVELGLKLALERAGVADIPNDHRIGVLVGQCERAMESAGLVEDWQRFEADHGAFLELLNEVDSRSFVFRYPVDTRGEAVSRPPLVDLVELEAEDARFHRSVERLVDLMACRESLRLTMPEAVAASSEIADAIRAINTAHAAVELSGSFWGVEARFPVFVGRALCFAWWT
jgi:hypothetical protein